MDNQIYSSADIGIGKHQSLTGKNVFDGDDSSWAIAATQPRSRPAQMTQSGNHESSDGDVSLSGANEFLPVAPRSFEEAGLRESQVEALILKYLLNVGGATGRQIAQQVALPFGIVETLLHLMKAQQLVVFRSGTALGDYEYQLTDTGSERGRRHAKQSSYFGAAPVVLDDYVQSVARQSVSRQKPSPDAVKRAFADLILAPEVTDRIGEAINMGLTFFVHGQPGNGKTSVAERVVQAYGQTIWIPRAVSVGGEVIRLYDPNHHEEVPLDSSAMNEDGPGIDRRWLRIRRPTMVFGGELQLENLEVSTNAITGISEAPIQLKCNGGVLVIDDFGRNKFEPSDLLNRLIVPLEKRVDYLNLPSGRAFKVPFDPLVIFSTNVDPLELVDEAFLRRIPFTIRVCDPTENQYRAVFQRVAKEFGLRFDPNLVDDLLQRQYREASRPLRFCHPRDLLQHVKNACEYRRLEPVITAERIEAAVSDCLALRSRVVSAANS